MRQVLFVLVFGSHLANVVAERNLAVHQEGYQSSSNAVVAVDARGHQRREVQTQESNSSERSFGKVAAAEAHVCCWSWDSAQDKLVGQPRGRHLNALIECNLVTDGPCSTAQQPKLKSLFNAKEVLQAKLGEAVKVQAEGVKSAEKVYKQAKQNADYKHKAAVDEAARSKKSAQADAKNVYEAALAAAAEGEVARKQRAEKNYEVAEQDATAEKELQKNKAKHWYKEEEAAVRTFMGLDTEEDSYKDLLAKRQTCGKKQWCCCRYQGISQLVPVEFDLTTCSSVAAAPLWTGCNYFERCQKCETPLCGEHQACHDEPAQSSTEPARAAEDMPAKTDTEPAKDDIDGPPKVENKPAEDGTERAMADNEIVNDGNEIANAGNETVKDSNETANDGNETANDGSESSKADDDTVRYSSETSKADNETAQHSNETANDGNETAINRNETANDSSETANDGHETANDGNETANDGNETANDGHETANNGNETNDSNETNDGNETAKADSETVRYSNETANEGNETANDGNETSKADNETVGDSNETANDGNETANDDNDTANADNETATDSNETANDGNETSKADNDPGTADNETAQAGLVQVAMKGGEVGSEGGVSGESKVCCWKWNTEADKLDADEHGRHSSGLTKCNFVTDGSCSRAQGEPKLKSLFNAKDVFQGKLQAKAAQEEDRVKMAIEAFRSTMKSAKESRKKAIAEAHKKMASEKNDAKTSYKEAITASEEAEVAQKQNAQASHETAVKQAAEALEAAKRKGKEEFKRKEAEIRTEMGYESKDDSYEQDLDAKRKQCGKKWCCCRYEGFSQLVPANFDLTKCSTVAASTFWTRCNYFERCQKCETPLCGKNQACKA